MNTIMLSPKMPAGYGGRPLTLGKLVHGEGIGQWGFFLGYDQANKTKVIISQNDLEICLKGLDANYKVRVNVERVSQFNFSHLVSNLIPEKIKQEIKQTI